jgi:hypothetical protein
MERDIIEARKLKSGHDILLPVLIDDYKPKWLPPTRIYFNFSKEIIYLSPYVFRLPSFYGEKIIFEYRIPNIE